jgi:3-hydroxybutyryl-CoA dehydratase
MNTSDSLPILTRKVEPEAMIALARILHDPNPIHLDPEAAQAAGLGNRVVNQGPANLAYIIDMLTAAFPDHRLAKLDSRYLANVFGGDKVQVGGTVTRVEEPEIECDTWLKVPDGTIAVVAVATLVRR